MSKNKKILIAVLATIFVCMAVFAALLIFSPTHRSNIKDLFVPDPTFLLPTENALVLDEYTLEELKNDSRVTFSQAMLLVNTEHKISDLFEAEIGEYKNTGVIMNVCIMDAYQALAASVSEKYDQKLYISSSYRTAEKQAEILESKPTVATQVGASEHQTGLALDVYVPYFSGKGFINCPAGQYVNSECQNFGFIIRYPSYGVDKTGITYEPWHLRYVGLPHSVIIAENEITLEEYYESINENEYYKYGDYIITRSKGDTFLLPAVFETMDISPDNMGGYMITVKVS